MKRSKTLTYFLISLSVIFWGISFILTKELFLTEEHMTVTILIALRLAIATLVMLPTLALTRNLEPIKKGDLKWFLLLALCEPFIYHLCETSGVQLVSGQSAAMFRNVISCIGMDPITAMEKTINSERYEAVTVEGV